MLTPIGRNRSTGRKHPRRSRLTWRCGSPVASRHVVSTDLPPSAAFIRAVEHAIGEPLLDLGAVEREPIAYDAFLAGRFVLRLRGRALALTGPVAWSMIEKVTEGPAHATPYLYDNGLRELRAYQTGMLDDLAPGLAAPRAHGLDEGPDGRLTIWLEDLGDGLERSASDILLAARHLGRLAGRWRGRVPDEPWLFTGWIDRHSQPEAVDRDMARLRAVRRPEELGRRLGWSVDDAIALIDLQPVLRRLLEKLAHTLCHHDAVAANVFRRAGGGETILIDWEMVGPGPVGADLASLLFSSVRRGDLSAATMSQLRLAALDAYAKGIRDVGEEGDRALIGLGFQAAVALRWSLVRDVALAIDEGRPVVRGSVLHEPSEEALSELVALTRVVFECAASVREAIMNA
jgi:Phosphotransferase enzyme family